MAQENSYTSSISNTVLMKQIALLLTLLIIVQGIFASSYKRWVAPTLGDPYIPQGALSGYGTGIPVENLTALARVPLGGNTTAVFIFKLTGDTIFYDLYLEGFSSKSDCISWTVGINHVMSYTPGKCYYSYNILCITPANQKTCIFNIREPAECRASLGVSGIYINETVSQNRTLIASGSSTTASLAVGNKYTIEKRFMLVSYSFDDQVVPEYFCANIELGTGTIDNFITSGTTVPFKSISSISFTFVLVFIILYY